MTKDPDDIGPFDLITHRVSQHLEASRRESARRKMDAMPPREQAEEASRRESARRHIDTIIPPQQIKNIDAVLDSRRMSYRDVLMIQLAYRITSDGASDLTVRHPGARTVGRKLGEFFAGEHIRGVQDAFQNIGKNSPNLVRGNFSEFDSFLSWASTDRNITAVEIDAALEYTCAAVAATARPVFSMPALNRGALTFAKVSGLLNSLFDIGSQGAYEQFSIAALLSALLKQIDTRHYRVSTKNLNASDKSSRVAGDIQIMMGNRVVEAYEVTANDWKTKLPSAEKTVKDHDLTRIHILASVREDAVGELLRELEGQAVDVSVLNLRDFAGSLVSALTRAFRAEALVRLYEYLDRYLPDVERVNGYVRLIESHELTESEP